MRLLRRAPSRRAQFVAALTAVGLSAGLVPGLGLTTANAGSTTATVKTGVYRGASQWGAADIPAYEKFVGKSVDYALDFQATDTWDNQAWPEWQSSGWKGRTVVLGATGIFPGGWDRKLNGVSVCWTQAARGDYDAHWRRLGQRLVATGQSGAVLRGAHEFNGGWFPHRVHPEEAAAFTTAWRRWVTIMRAVPGQSFTFDWNPTIGSEWPLYKPEIAYPGDAYVDRIALDVYDGWYNKGWKQTGGQQPSAAERDQVWHTILHGERGMVFWRNFAVAHGKRMSLPEWGLRLWKESDGLVHGGGDNAVFIQRMSALIKDPAWRIDYHAFWEDRAGGVLDPDSARAVAVPLARAAYLKAFGTVAGSTSRPAPTSTAPKPVRTPSGAPTVTPLGRTALDCGMGTRRGTAVQVPVSYSPWSSRAQPRELAGRAVAGAVHVWVPSTAAVSVSLRLDGRAPRIDTAAPFDLVGGDSQRALPLRLVGLRKGVHTVEVTAQRSTGCLTRTVTFTVR